MKPFLNSQSVLLIDAYAHIYRIFHGSRLLSSSKGIPTNVTYGMIRFLNKVTELYPADYRALVFDKGKSKERFSILDSYKANRKPMPDELREQVPYIQEWFKHAGWSIIIEEGREADDLIAGIVKLSTNKSVYIVTNDKDLAQLVDESVFLLTYTTKNDFKLMDISEVIKKFGVKPEQIEDYLALVGDTADNIKGLQGVGAKTAVTLLSKYSNMAGIKKNAKFIEKKKLREVLMASSELMDFNKQLVRLYDRPPKQWTGIETIRKEPEERKKLREMAQELDFKNLTF